METKKFTLKVMKKYNIERADVRKDPTFAL